MQTQITIQGGQQPSPTAPWNFTTNQGVFKAWPTVGDDPSPIVEMLRNGIGQAFLVQYTEKDWLNPKTGENIKQRYLDRAEPGNADPTPSVDANRVQTVAQASPVASAGVGYSGTLTPPQGDIRTSYDGVYRSPMMSFVSDVVAGAMQSGKFGWGDIFMLTEFTKQAWEGVPSMGEEETGELWPQPTVQADGDSMPEVRS